MGNKFTLDSLREEVERKYAPLEIDLSDGTTVTLRQLLVLPDKVRDKVIDTLKVLEDKDQDTSAVAEAATQVLKLIADNGSQLVRELDGNLALIMLILERWMESTQVGEATPSAG